jgi:murein DD-endopeptidase MepM/ murein hydrolase activator NlpD
VDDVPREAAVAPRDVAPTISPDTAVFGSDVEDLRQRSLLIPVRGLQADDLVSSFADARGSTRKHEAIDILAPRGTDVVAVEDGKVAKLFTSNTGGLTLYQFDPSERFVYYYAHLDSYAPGIKEGAKLQKGDVVGAVGTTGNAPKNTPHLHFAIAKRQTMVGRNRARSISGVARSLLGVVGGAGGRDDLFHCETVQVSVAARRDQVRLAAALAPVR